MSKSVKKTTKKNTKPRMRPYLVTTAHRGVFFGWADDIDGTTITLHKARNCIYWSADCRGFLGLANTGPTSGCRIGAPAEELQVRAVTSVALCSDAAAHAWGIALWSK